MIFLKDILKEDDNHLIDKLINECQEIVYFYKDPKTRFRLYRGERSRHNAIQYRDPRVRERVSLDIPNINTTLLKGLPSWKKAGIPMRNKSVVFTADLNAAGSYGDIYYVFPTDDANIGYGTQSDNWANYAKASTLIFGRYVDFNVFNRFLHVLILVEFGEEEAEKVTVSSDFSSLKAKIDLMDANLKGVYKKLSDTQVGDLSIKGFLSASELSHDMELLKKVISFGGLWTVISTYFDPDVNGIKHSKLSRSSIELESSFASGKSIEYWTDSPCYLIYQREYSTLRRILGDNFL